METIIDASMTVKDIDSVTEHIRAALKRTITRRFCEGGSMKVITLDAELEKSIITSLTSGRPGNISGAESGGDADNYYKAGRGNQKIQQLLAAACHPYKSGCADAFVSFDRTVLSECLRSFF